MRICVFSFKNHRKKPAQRDMNKVCFGDTASIARSNDTEI